MSMVFTKKISPHQWSTYITYSLFFLKDLAKNSKEKDSDGQDKRFDYQTFDSQAVNKMNHGLYIDFTQ